MHEGDEGLTRVKGRVDIHIQQAGKPRIYVDVCSHREAERKKIVEEICINRV